MEYLRVGNVTRQVRIYQPEGPGPFPVLLSVHGGAWSRGDHTNNPLTNLPLAASGMVVAAIGLRVAPEFPYPLQVQDTNYATRWLKVHAGEFNGDASSLGAIGYSSGGHTVPLSAMRPDDPPVQRGAAGWCRFRGRHPGLDGVVLAGDRPVRPVSDRPKVQQ